MYVQIPAKVVKPYDTKSFCDESVNYLIIIIIIIINEIKENLRLFYHFLKPFYLFLPWNTHKVAHHPKSQNTW